MLNRPKTVIDRMRKELDTDSSDKDMLWYVSKINIQGVRDSIEQITGQKPDEKLVKHVISCIEDQMDDAGDPGNIWQFIKEYQEDGQ